MKRLTALLCLSVPLLLGQMCGAPEVAPPPQCLEIGDVINIPPGTATGSSFSGTYRGLTAVVTACLECGQNAVPEAQCNSNPFNGQVFAVTQQGGTLRFEHPECSMNGGVNADGIFTVGGILSPTRDDGVVTGQALILIEGNFSGDLIIATARTRGTFQLTDGRLLDMQAVAPITFERED